MVVAEAGAGRAGAPERDSGTPRRVGAFTGRPGWRDVDGRRLNLADLGLAAAIGLVAMLVAFLLRSALVPTDPWHYVQGAVNFPNGTWRPEGLSRWGYLLPMLPFAWAWGDSTATYYVLPLLSTGLLAAVLFLLGTRAVNRAAGGLGALLALGTPLVFVNLTRGYTDLTATALCGLALLLAVQARDAHDEAMAAGRGWGRVVPAWLLAVGFVAGWSAEVRETAVFTWGAIALVLWRLGPFRVLLWVIGPILAWVALDLLLLQVIYGDPLLKIRWVLGADISNSEVTSDGGYVGHSRNWYATVLVRSLWSITSGPAILGLMVVAIVGGVLFRRRIGHIWAWGMLALLPLWLQGGALNPEHPSVRSDVARYWLSFLVPLMLVAACAMVIAFARARDWGRWVTGGVSAVLCLGLLLPCVGFARSYPGFFPNGGDALSQLRDELSDSEVDPNALFWSDWGTQRVLPAYQNSPFGTQMWDGRGFRSLNRLFREDIPLDKKRYPGVGDYIVLYSVNDRTCWHCRRAMRPVKEAFGPFPAAGWELLFTSETGNLSLYKLGPGFVWPLPHSEENDTEESDSEEPGL